MLALLDPRLWGAAALAVMLAYGAGWWRGSSHAGGECRAAAERARADALAADLAAATRAAEAYRTEAARNAAAADLNRALIEEMRNAPPDSCTLSPDDAERLRRIK